MPMRMTPGIARAAAQDAGDRSMRRAGRAGWNADDWNAAVAEMDRLMLLLPAPVSVQPQTPAIAAERRRCLAARDRSNT